MPLPPATENRFVVPLNVQAPPTSAEPQPLLAVRVKASRASAVSVGGAVTVIDRVAESVASSSSVTVRVTV